MSNIDFLSTKWALNWFMDEYGNSWQKFLSRQGPINTIGTNQTRVLLVKFFSEHVGRPAKIVGDTVAVYFGEDEETLPSLKYE